MKISIPAAVAFLLLMRVPLSAQAPEPPPAQETKQIPGAKVETPTAGQNSDLEGDLYPQLRENADLLKSKFEESHNSNMRTIERLTLTKKCTIARVIRLLDDTKRAMQQWFDAENNYWQAWNEKETKRAEGQMKVLATWEEDQADLVKLMEDENKTQQQLERNKNALDNSRRTEDSRAEIDRLIKDIRESQARLTDDQQKYEALTAQIKESKSMLSTKLEKVRTYIQSIRTYTADKNALYASKRAEAEAICDMKQPTSRTPLPKSVAK
jgi:chromosome segregation ATPase